MNAVKDISRAEQQLIISVQICMISLSGKPSTGAVRLVLIECGKGKK